MKLLFDVQIIFTFYSHKNKRLWGAQVDNVSFQIYQGLEFDKYIKFKSKNILLLMIFVIWAISKYISQNEIQTRPTWATVWTLTGFNFSW